MSIKPENQTLKDDYRITECDYCHRPMETGKGVPLFDLAFMHPKCYRIVIGRIINNFWELIMLPENDFNEWLDDDGV